MIALWTLCLLVMALFGAALAGWRVALWPRLRPKPGRPAPPLDRRTACAVLLLAGPVAAGWSLAPLSATQAGLLVLLGIVLGAQAGHDWRRGLLPLPESVALAALGAAAVAVEVTSPADAALGSGVGVALFWGLNRLWRWRRGGPAFGGGDLRLMAGLGLWTGLTGLPCLLAGAALTGLAAAALIRAPGRIAFGPWLALAGWAVVLIKLLDIAPGIR